MQPIQFGRREIVLTWPVKCRVGVRAAAITLVMLGGVLVLAAMSLVYGTMQVRLIDAVGAIFGQAEGMTRTVVVEWRLSRVVAAIVFGAGLGVSGAIFQSLTKNPLGSPDIIGFSSGAYTGALLVLLGTGAVSFAMVATGAIAGGLATAVIVYALAFRGGSKGFRLIIAGIALSAMLSSLNAMLLLRSDSDAAFSAAAWGIGSLNGVSWLHVAPASIVTLVLLLLSGLQTRALREIELGDDAAKAHGVSIERSRFLLIATAVVLTAVPTSVMGPVTFVALAAPQIARRLAGSSRSLIPAAVMGALLLLASDFLAQRAVKGTILPVGVVTLSLGGVYLVWLLFSQARKRQHD
ncbi:FecCD family ABC transporter permease [Paenibacillus gorillae]|uniref:FecCD family ABC transporter permease n=1 Tax=Paenibacillus gorillae TaxID=1243662 RepID=UPI0005A8AA1D|nr:iron chelate uptake ABC transporter family permease subunit [Paenibacillus gorillae]